MDRGAERGVPPGRPEGGAAVAGTAGRLPLAVVVVGHDRLVSHWSRSARRLFRVPREEAVGRTATDLLPVSGALPDEDGEPPDLGRPAHGGPGPARGTCLDDRLSRPFAGRARMTVPDRHRLDVLWWAYPLVGPGRERLLVLAADADDLWRFAAGGTAGDAAGAGSGHEAGRRARRALARVAPAFTPRTGFPGAGELARGLPEALPGMSAGESARIVSQVFELGCPVLEFGPSDRVPVTPDRGVPRPSRRDGS